MRSEEYRKVYSDLQKESDGMSSIELQDFMKSFYAETYLAR
jgi:hypothetical protein